jgi:hypothetical protein
MGNAGEAEMSDTQQFDQTNFVYDLFGASSFDMMAPLQYRLFDPQICGALQEDWLTCAVESHGISRPELDAMIAGKLLRRWKDNAGKEGFLLYSEQQARVAKNLQTTGRYSEAELQHIFAGWNEFLETLSSDMFAYDDMDGDDYESFRRRSREMTDFFADEIARMEDDTPNNPRASRSPGSRHHTSVLFYEFLEVFCAGFSCALLAVTRREFIHSVPVYHIARLRIFYRNAGVSITLWTYEDRLRPSRLNRLSGSHNHIVSLGFVADHSHRNVFLDKCSL